MALGNLASVYISLERYADALVMQERVLEFRRRVLPENHPEIGRGMCGVMRCMCVLDGDFRFYRLGLVQHQFELQAAWSAAECVEMRA
jgi:hypothetical protein